MIDICRLQVLELVIIERGKSHSLKRLLNGSKKYFVLGTSPAIQTRIKPYSMIIRCLKA